MPSRLRPTTPTAADAILVGDPGRALMLAQALLEAPKMSNHARGLWGYSGQTPGGAELTIQATGMGGPSATVVLADLAKLGLRRAVRVGTCVAIDPRLAPGELLAVREAHTWSGGGSGEPVLPDPALGAALRERLGAEARPAIVASLDVLHSPGATPPASGDAVDMQTAALLGGAPEHGVRMAAVLVVAESASGERLSDDEGEQAARRAGEAACGVLSP